MTEQFELHSQLAADCVEVAELPLCKLLLCNDSNYPWFILVPKVHGVSEVFQLEWNEQQQLLNESSMIAEMLMQTFNGDKLNVAALGNVVPQLHIHHVVRFENDAAWPKPIWGVVPTKQYSNAQLEEIKLKVLPQLEAVLAK
ncbi:HIT domain-containing protein [Thalassotalea atypica]|uniref:HIT domain-containing protein n=1 Tax=Thalassotalea atypica TaxID=2054316 RepID=UPI0025728754|nr:HIT domain-containing protein [Thalassotalea atypica]